MHHHHHKKVHHNHEEDVQNLAWYDDLDLDEKTKEGYQAEEKLIDDAIAGNLGKPTGVTAASL